jgi:hypothetical protein
MMCADASLHADETGREISKSCVNLTTRPLLQQHDRAAINQTNDVEEFFPIWIPTTRTICPVVALAVVPSTE